MKANTILSAAALCTVAVAQVAVYGQCGGNGYQGETACASGSSCVVSNEWYSQCLPGATGGTTPAPPVEEEDEEEVEEPIEQPCGEEVEEVEEEVEQPCGEEEEYEEPVEEEPVEEEPVEEEPVEEEPVEEEPEESTPPTTSPGTPTTGGTVSSVIPAAAGTVETNEPIYITGEFDGGMKLYDRDTAICAGQNEGGEADTIFVLEDGATLSNVIIGPNQGEGIYCLGQCTLNNVWFEDVCEDAISFKGNAATSFINGGGAFHADDKIIQFNGEGTIHVSDFYAEDYGKVARSCGNCDGGSTGRHFIMENVHAVNGGELCGVNANFGDSCTITGNSCQAEGKSCTIWEGTSGGGEPTKLSSEPDGQTCIAESLRDTC
ncbi:hypothetical protein S40293_04127 [Stachybotrys chartarum IBT 40293]|nr:hypothetical protein S40293_04127 [Stachybotrys chartarum IBT 40293]